MAHDQLWKELVREFFRELMEMFFPLAAARIDFSSLALQDKELFTDLPQGLMREPDFIARVQTLDGESELILIHIEVQARRERQFGARMAEYFMLLRLRFRIPVFPVVIYLEKGTGGAGTDRYQESVFDVPVLTFDYQRIGVPDLNPGDLSASNPLYFALAALMNRGEKAKPQHKADCLLGVARTDVNEARRSLLINCVETYLPLDAEEQQTFDQLMHQPQLEEVTTMLNVYEVRAEARGMAIGEEREGTRARREAILICLRARFGEVPPAIEASVRAVSDRDKLDALLAAAAKAPSLDAINFADSTH